MWRSRFLSLASASLRDDDFATHMHDLLAVAIVSQHPQSLETISGVLDIDNTVTAVVFSRLRNIVETDETDEDSVVHVLPSVRDYLVDSARCDPTVAVSRLRSIVETDENSVVHVIPSVRDYLVDPTRCDPTLPLFIDEDEEHRLMAVRCIRYLDKTLTRKTREGQVAQQTTKLLTGNSPIQSPMHPSRGCITSALAGNP
ncbi:hypothetical protein B0H17DRAFT_1097059 [Mycena rosella]|uniref:Uncharacterized protein n=1 Tax=Mycena rosella TaxID=1033263 RepID=A0AAD7CRA4_MYCRO|nr:hypothetical protein B0H17DRAFT_1097059 [Mycena rosella]